MSRDDTVTRTDSGTSVTVTRVDRGKLGKARKIGADAVRIDASMTRTGVLVYKEFDGKERREYRPPEEVFHEDSLASANGIPVTIQHPRVGLVNRSNASTLQHGYVVDGVRANKDRGLVDGTLQLNTEDVQKRVDQGELVECSMGYKCRLDWTPGITGNGEKYDCIQRDIRYNHVALGPSNWGRAGNEVGLHLDSNQGVIDAGRLDSKGDAVLPDQEDTVVMKIIKIDGREFEYGSEAHINYLESQHQSKIDSLQAQIVTETKRADGLAGQVDQLNKQNKDFNEPAHLDSLVQERVRVINVAQQVIGEKFNADGKSNKQIMVEAIAAADSEFKADGKSEDYLLGSFNTLAKRLEDPNDKSNSTWGKARRQDNKDEVAAASKKKEQEERTDSTKALEDHKTNMSNRWKKTLGIES